MWLPPALLLLSLPGYLSIQGPKFVRGSERGSVKVECHYKPQWETYTKWWCQGASWESCKILLQTTGSEQEVKTDRMSIRDNQSNHSLTVTMTQLRRDDTDIYWCGIERLGPDLGAQINVTVDPEATTPASLLTASNQTGVSPGSYIRTGYMLLVFVKVPVLLILVGAVLWLKGEVQQGLAIYTNLSSDLLTKDTAP
uniref:CD300 molecule like family member b n=1 Tax=Equus asinus TaxID=9793 RepID=A0A8C4MTW8_EQUAS